ncbi:Zn/Cd-binding protein ZinT [Dysgonomonas sp. PH5-45]|uniref:hypothetical protein n=1 Tax=unclassified Dysgonomonas TaxID=2630389 RepID=UPI002473B1CE|nr:MULTISPECIES: hypothetical protein [unclassified Dysgonomonas]MDH6356137.1 Zn/Cd-binding protein ZinT [Dysgonomonas sp. PH5-45]MDH6389031.1 Zn/Cd-binding protein ZinT [Dysgonomonas sp. PH5-37]
MEKNSNSKGNPLINLFVILLFGWIMYLIFTTDSRSQKEREKEDAQFPEIENISKEFKGTLVKTGISNAYVGRTLLYFSNGQKAAITDNTFNYAISEVNLMSFVQVEDSIYKPANSDSIFIYRGDKTYYFRLGQTLNNSVN